MKKKNFLYFIILCTLLIYLFFKTDNAMGAIKEGAELFFVSVLPSLFPFLVISNIFFMLDYTKYLAKIFNPFMSKYFKVSGSGAYPLITSIISGYPVGSKTVSEMYINGDLSYKDANKLIAICSTPGPIFVIGTVATSFFNIPIMGAIILLSIYSSLFIYASVLFKQEANTYNHHQHYSYKKHHNIGKVLSKSIKNSMETLINVLGYIMFFSLIINIFDSVILTNLSMLPFKSSLFLSNFIKGLLEMTIGIKGISELSYIPIPIIIASITFILSFGGLCANMQCISFISNTDLNIKGYLFAKIKLGIISGGLAYILSSFFLRGVTSTINIGINMPFTFNLTSSLLFTVIYTFIIFTTTALIKKEI